MKKIDVYGIGNALVDVEFELSDKDLITHQITKGVMTLIDKSTHHRILKSLHGTRHSRTCGGSAANTILTLQQLGAKTFFSFKVGNDEYGDLFYRDLNAHGVETNIQSSLRYGVTGKCLVLITPDAERTMNTFLGVTYEFSAKELSEEALKNSEFLYIEGYLVAAPLGFKAAMTAHKMAQKHHVKTVISLSDPNMVTYFKDRLVKIIDKKVDIMFCNEKESLLFTDTDNISDAKDILKQSAETFVITLGKEGVLVYDGHVYSHVPACSTKVVDTTGAGDIFAGSFLYAIINGSNYVEAANLANFAASKVISKFGPRLTQTQITEVNANYNVGLGFLL